MQFRLPGNQFPDNSQIVRAELEFNFFIRQYSAVQLPDSAAESLPAQGYGVRKSSVKIKNGGFDHQPYPTCRQRPVQGESRAGIVMMKLNRQDVSSRAERSTFHSRSLSKSLMYGKTPKEYLSLWSVIALGIGSMVGAGIFALMGQATLMAGKNVYWSFFLGGVAALLSGYTYAKLGSRYPGSGGIMDYFNEAFSHKTLSGALTLIYLGTLVITVALVAKSFGAYASRLFLPDRAVTIYSTALFASVAILLLGALNMGGARAVGKSEVIMVAFKLLILTVLMLASFGSSVPVGADSIPVKGLDGLLGSVGLTFFAFAGYGMMANTAGNLKNPSKTLPRAIFLAIGLVLVLYLILSYVVLSNVPATSLESHTETAVAQAAYPVLGMWGFMAVSVAALIATASAINATMFSMLDISRALARNGQLGAIFKQPFWGHGTEGFFYLLLGILVMTNAFNLVAIANLAGACFLISYLAVFVAHWRLRKETRGNVLLIILGFLLMLFILGAFFYQMFFSQPYLIPLIVLFVAACFILEFLIRRKIAKNAPKVS